MDRPISLLQIELKPSRIARYYCAVAMLLSWLAIGLADLLLSVQMLLCAVAAAYGWRAIQQLQMPPFSALACRNQNWLVQLADDLQANGLQAVELQKNIFVGAGIIALSLQLPTGRKIRAVLWPDSADADSLRRLRAALLAR